MKSYTISEELNDKSQHVVTRTNDGFTSLELLGLLSLATQEILQQMSGEVVYDVIKRQVVED